MVKGFVMSLEPTRKGNLGYTMDNLPELGEEFVRIGWPDTERFKERRERCSRVGDKYVIRKSSPGFLMLTNTDSSWSKLSIREENLEHFNTCFVMARDYHA